MTPDWAEVGDRVFVRRHASLDLNCGLIVGDGGCLVVDTRSDLDEARDLIAAVRRVTPHPWTVVNTHAHYDHCFGNAAFRPAEIWASRGCAAAMPSTVDRPDRLVDDVAHLEIGGREVVLRFLGRGHTDHDLVVDVDDGAVVFAGDLVEEGAPPAFEDAFPAEWPATLGRVHLLARGPVVPGHGAVVDAEFVASQREELLAVVTALREGRLDAGPYDEATMRTAAARLP